MDNSLNEILTSIYNNDKKRFDKALLSLDSLTEDKRSEILRDALQKIPDVLAKWDPVMGYIHRYSDDSFCEYLKKILDKGLSSTSEQLNFYGRLNNPLAKILNIMSVFPDICSVVTDLFINNGMSMKDGRPLRAAIVNVLPEIVEKLLDAGMNPNIIVQEYSTRLFLPLNIALEIATKATGDVTKKHLSKEDSLRIVSMLIDSGASLVNQDFEPAVFVPKDTETVNFLMQYSPDLSILNSSGINVLQYWLSTNNLDMADCFLKHGADPNWKNKLGKNSAYYVHTENAIRLLSSYGTEFNTEDLNGIMPIVSLIEMPGSKYYDLVKAAVNAGANINYQNRDGQTALHILTNKRQLTLFNGAGKSKDLILLGADLNIRDNNGSTPFLNYILSVFNGYTSDNAIELAELMIEHGAELYTKNNLGIGFNDSYCSPWSDRLKQLYKHVCADRQTMEEDMRLFER